MVIKIKGADFSENNIGQIELIRELSPETLAILANYTRTLSNDQKFALQDFIDALKEEGLWAEISSLYLPVLAGGVGETLYNVKTGVKDATPTTDYYEMSGNGLMPKAGTTYPTSDVLTIPLPQLSNMDYHFGVYTNQLPATESTQNTIFVYGAKSSKYFGVRFQVIPKGYNNLSVGEYTSTNYQMVYQSTYNQAVSGFIAASSTQSGYIGIQGDVTTTDTGNIAPNDTPFESDHGIRVGFSHQSPAQPFVYAGMKLITIGHSLTAAQLSKYNDLCDTFMGQM